MQRDRRTRAELWSVLVDGGWSWSRAAFVKGAQKQTWGEKCAKGKVVHTIQSKGLGVAKWCDVADLHPMSWRIFGP